MRWEHAGIVVLVALAWTAVGGAVLSGLYLVVKP